MSSNLSLMDLMHLIRSSSEAVFKSSSEMIEEFDFHLQRLNSEYTPIQERYNSLAHLLVRFAPEDAKLPDLKTVLEFDKLAKVINHFETEIEMLKEMESHFNFVREENYDKDIIKALLGSDESSVESIIAKKDEYDFEWLSNCRKIIETAGIKILHKSGLSDVLQGIEKQDETKTISTLLQGGSKSDEDFSTE